VTSSASSPPASRVRAGRHGGRSRGPRGARPRHARGPRALLRTRLVSLPGERAALVRAKSRLDQLVLYPAPVDLRGVRIVVAPWLFRMPGFRPFRGYATRHLIILKRPLLDTDLITHELCHIWQLQHRPVRLWVSYARPSTFSRDRSRYRANRYEREAREAVELTRE
jgi:hypothetical protein